ncbi:MAG TPA: sigma-70 family RNA polymerase sigma factor [Acetobacteraceae bacterium]|nr:sigma-70 family RNA polymerase sigma factor [Acetobacteraceae bacterium]
MLAIDPAGRDAALMARIVAGDEAALRDVALLHGGRVLRLAQRMLGSAAEADEVAQDTLLRVWQHAADWDQARAGLPGWMSMIAWRLCADRLRAPSRHAHVNIELADDVPSREPDAETALMRAQSMSLIQRALQALPARQRAAFLLFYVEEVSGQEAADILGLRLRAFWSLLHRAREAVERQVGVTAAKGSSS